MKGIFDCVEFSNSDKLNAKSHYTYTVLYEWHLLSKQL